ncbi:WD-repeat containing protein SWD2 [Sporobolomyces salmoneus]|uniref:WD-repeat containing protein SWD2 n=1 Tax=Sporobolomyces salmoneus TaxID=183962 RepID=UPI00317F2204
MESTTTASSSTSGSPVKLPSNTVLSPNIVNTFKPAKVFKKHCEEGKQYTSLSFDRKGELLMTSADDESMQLFDAKSGKHHKQFLSKKYGCHLARFTHKSSAIIYASTKGNDDIRYLSLHDNSYLRYFKGHTKRVVSLAMSPQDDTFLSGSTDDTIKLWDLRTATSQGHLNVAGHPSIGYDPSGMVFGVALNLNSTVLMYDIKNFDKAPFLVVHIEDPILRTRSYPPRVPVFTSISYSNDSKWLLVGTSGDTHYVLDAYEGNIVARLEGPKEAANMGLERAMIPPHERPIDPHAGLSGEEVKWSPDGRYVIGGSIDGSIHVWDVAPPPSEVDPSRPAPGPGCTLYPMKSFENAHPKGPSRVVAFNPRSAMFASAGNELAFWLPDPKDAFGTGNEGNGIVNQL